MSIVRRNNVHVVGTGEQAMMLAHGYGCDQNMWRFVAPAFAGRFRVVLFDYVGAGQSDLSAYHPARYSTLDGYATDVLEICRELELTGTVFVGHSISAMIGVRAAILEPRRFDKLVHVAPSPRYIDEDDYRGGFSRQQIEELLAFLDENHLGWSRTMAPIIMGNPDRPELSKELVLQSQKDVIAPLEVGRYVHEHLPDSRFVLLDAIGHCPHLSHPDQVTAAIDRFVTRENPS